MIRVHEERFAVRMMCRVMRVSPSGYYDWQVVSPQHVRTRVHGWMLT